ncbi:MAG TPA: hypothetical protein VJB58_02425 [Candidatus Paceibacterota bacterium]
MKLTAKQLGELFGVDRGKMLYKAIDPLYDRKLELAALSEDSIKKILKPFQYCGGPENVEILSARNAEKAISFFGERRIDVKLATSVAGYDWGSSRNDQFGRGFDVVYRLLNIKFPPGEPFEKITVRESNLWKLARASFKSSLCQAISHVCHFKFEDDRKQYVDERNKSAWAITNLFLAGGFYVGYYPTNSIRIHPNTVLVLVK